MLVIFHLSATVPNPCKCRTKRTLEAYCNSTMVAKVDVLNTTLTKNGTLFKVFRRYEDDFVLSPPHIPLPFYFTIPTECLESREYSVGDQLWIGGYFTNETFSVRPCLFAIKLGRVELLFVFQKVFNGSELCKIYTEFEEEEKKMKEMGIIDDTEYD
ncbi:unnamed protein product [Cylicocyclus nassatus]|uniref:Uncharacterized protein n=1 Tax=Cylicocyclus nassatus TaxID=53992 RepID=A0AA36GQZ3_CYLNA|nr:unnamed protein product [Cylicocyclus nassatus]